MIATALVLPAMVVTSHVEAGLQGQQCESCFAQSELHICPCPSPSLHPPPSLHRARKVVQRYHMSAATHPRLLGRNMAAAGLRDAEDEDAYDEDDLEGGDWEEEEEGRVGSGMGEEWGPSSLSLSSSWGPRGLMAAGASSGAGGGGSSSGLLRAGSLETSGLAGGRPRPWLL